MDWFSSWTAWLILGFVLLIGEILLPGIFLLWWGLGAIISGLVLWIIPTLSFTAIGIFYAVLSLLLSLLWWRYQHRKDQQDDAHSVLNQRDHSLIGNIGLVQEFHSNGIGRGKFGDTTWRIMSQNAEPLHVNDKIEVVQVQGITLYVRKCAE